MTRYLLDANIFIEAKNRHYGLDFCPAFWNWLIEQNRAGTVASVEAVAEELVVQADELAAWAGDRGDAFFLIPDEAVQLQMNTVSEWVMGKNRRAAPEFLEGADPWLIAHAKAHDYVVVTHEVAVPESSRKIRIPNVCNGLGLECTTPWKMLRSERARFVPGQDRDVA